MISKDDLKVIFKNLGARVTSDVSFKTNILIYGEYFEHGRKYIEGKNIKWRKKIKLKFILIKNLKNIYKNY